jgi:hypothetical protein
MAETKALKETKLGRLKLHARARMEGEVAFYDTPTNIGHWDYNHTLHMVLSRIFVKAPQFHILAKAMESTKTHFIWCYKIDVDYPTNSFLWTAIMLSQQHAGHAFTSYLCIHNRLASTRCRGCRWRHKTHMRKQDIGSLTAYKQALTLVRATFQLSKLHNWAVVSCPDLHVDRGPW